MDNQPNWLPCPFCGGSDLSKNTWSTDSGEEDAIECNSCYGSNLAKNWNTRAEQPDSKDTQRLDWLADTEQMIGNIQLPKQCVENNLNSMRAAIDCAMRIIPKNEDGLSWT